MLVLTHHRHLVEIARATLPKRRLDIIELSETQASDAIAPPADAPVVEEPATTRVPVPTPTLADELEAALVGGPPDDFGEQQTLL